MDEEVSVGAGARKITCKIRFDVEAGDVDSVGFTEFPDLGVCAFNFATPSDATKMTLSE